MEWRAIFCSRNPTSQYYLEFLVYIFAFGILPVKYPLKGIQIPFIIKDNFSPHLIIHLTIFRFCGAKVNALNVKVKCPAAITQL